MEVGDGGVPAGRVIVQTHMFLHGRMLSILQWVLSTVCEQFL